MTTAGAPLTALDLGDTRNLRIVRDGDAFSIWAFGRVRRLFFITGHPRSGTTWLASILMRHPAVLCEGEFHFQQLRRGFDLFSEAPYHKATHEPVRTAAACCFQDTIRLCMGAAAQSRLEADWIGDRTPRKLEVLLPGAPHIVMIRDGRDAIVSFAILEILNAGPFYRPFQHHRRIAKLRKRFLANPGYFKERPDELLSYKPFVRTLARYWADHVRHDRATAEQIRAGRLNARVHEVAYERLHRDPEGERRRIYEFLTVDPALALPLTPESGTTPGLGRDDHTSDRRQGSVGGWVRYFTRRAKRWFKQEAGDQLIAAGYAPDNAW